MTSPPPQRALHFALRNSRIGPYKDQAVILFNFELKKEPNWIVKKALGQGSITTPGQSTTKIYMLSRIRTKEPDVSY
jgi:hypothetical protein